MRKFFNLLFVLSVFSFSAHAQTLPTLAKQGKNLAAFVPKGWFILKQSTGDLNQDGLPDAAVIIGADSEKNSDNESPRILALLMKTQAGGYELAASESNFILCKGCGGVFGDPLDQLKIERGALVVNFYGGSRDRWGMTYRFRWQNGDWFLIGYTLGDLDTLELTSHTIDANWSTGTIKITDTKEDKSTNKSLKKNLPPIKLKNFDPAQCDKALGIL